MGTVLVTGGCGIIGRYVCSGLLKKGNIVIAVDSQYNDYNEGKNNYTYIEAAPDNKSAYSEIFENNKIDVLVHLACTVDNDMGDVITENEMNISKACDKFIYRFAIANDINKIVSLSTSQVYKLPDSREPLREDDAIKATNNYATMKLASEEAFANEIKHKKGMISAICRVAPVYTLNYYDNLVAKITDTKDKSNFVYGTGQYGFQFCCVHNLVDFILCFIKNADDVKYTGIYNISDKHLITASNIITFMRTNHRLGPVIQRSSGKATAGISNVLKKISGNKEEKTNYRYIDLSTFFNNNMLDNGKALKLSHFRWDINNTK